MASPVIERDDSMKLRAISTFFVRLDAAGVWNELEVAPIVADLERIAAAIDIAICDDCGIFGEHNPEVEH